MRDGWVGGASAREGVGDRILGVWASTCEVLMFFADAGRGFVGRSSVSSGASAFSSTFEDEDSSESEEMTKSSSRSSSAPTGMAMALAGRGGGGCCSMDMAFLRKTKLEPEFRRRREGTAAGMAKKMEGTGGVGRIEGNGGTEEMKI